MIASQFPRHLVRDIDFSFGANKTQRSILQYVRGWLPLFLKDVDGHFLSNAKEDDVSEELEWFFQKQMTATGLLFNLNRRWGSDFRIKTDAQGIGTEPIFLIEAKRLPSTTTRDYVHHRNKPGGISRFKLEQPGFGKHLTSSAMLGYVQKHDFDRLFKQVNGWISDLIESGEASELSWEETDMLIETERTPSVAEYTSTHERVSKEPIRLTHFWLNMVCDDAVDKSKDG